MTTMVGCSTKRVPSVWKTPISAQTAALLTELMTGCDRR